MADQKISELASGAPAAASDLFVVARGGANLSLTLTDILMAMYPVGSVYTNASDGTSPATLLGFGTWAALGAGRVIVGIDSGDTDFDVAGETGGAKTSPSSGTVSTPTFTGDANQVTSSTSGGTPAGAVSTPTLTMNAYTPTGNVSKPTFTGDTVNTTAVSGGTPAGTNSIPVLTGSAANTSAVSAGTPTGNSSIPVFSGSALGNHSHETPVIIASASVVRVLGNAVFGVGTTRAPSANFNTLATSLVNGNVALTQAVSAGTPAGTINAPAFTGDALATHNHNVVATGTINASVFTGNALASHNHNVALTGNISTPTFTGTANTLTGTISTPTFTGNALATHNHTITATGNISTPTYTGNSQSIVQPYVTCYVWKRTA